MFGRYYVSYHDLQLKNKCFLQVRTISVFDLFFNSLTLYRNIKPAFCSETGNRRQKRLKQVQDSCIFSRLELVFSLLSSIRGLSTKAEEQPMSFVYGRIQSCHLHTAFFYSIVKVRIVLEITTV